ALVARRDRGTHHDAPAGRARGDRDRGPRRGDGLLPRRRVVLHGARLRRTFLRADPALGSHRGLHRATGPSRPHPLLALLLPAWGGVRPRAAVATRGLMREETRR